MQAAHIRDLKQMPRLINVHCVTLCVRLFYRNKKPAMYAEIAKFGELFADIV